MNLSILNSCSFHIANISRFVFSQRPFFNAFTSISTSFWVALDFLVISLYSSISVKSCKSSTPALLFTVYNYLIFGSFNYHNLIFCKDNKNQNPGDGVFSKLRSTFTFMSSSKLRITILSLYTNFGTGQNI